MKKLFTFLTLLMISYNAFASHLGGGFIRYKVINDSTRTYQIVVEITRECTGIALPTTADVTVYCGNNCATQLIQLTLNEDSVKVKSQVCDITQTTCTGGTLPGLEIHYYSITTSLPVCTSKIYTFATSNSARNGAVQNISNPGSTDFSVYSSHRFNAIPTANFSMNTSPVLLAPPVPFFYSGSKVCYGLGAIDTVDNDSLAYELVTCYASHAVGNCATPVNYQSGFTALQPFGTGLVHSFDPVTGIISFTPPASLTGLYNFAIKIKEYRGGILIGEYIRDLQCSIITGGTNISCDPSIDGQDPIAGIDTVAKYATTCCGSPFQLDFTFAASSGGAFTLDSVNSNYPSWASVSLIVSPTSGLIVRLEGTPPCPGGYLAPITLKIQQKCLPGVTIPAVSIVIFKLFIREDFSAYPQNMANPLEDTIICAGGQVKLRAFGTTNPDYWWTVVKGDSASLPNGFTFQGSQYTAFPKRTTKYRVIDSTAVKLPGSCQFTDYVTVFVIDSFKVVNDFNPEDCKNERHKTSLAVVSKSPNFANNKIRMTYDWFASFNPLMPTKDSLEFNNNNSKTPRFTPVYAGQRCLQVVGIPKETKACAQRDTVCKWVRFNEYPKAFNGVKNLINYCKGDSIQLDVVTTKSGTCKPCATTTLGQPLSSTTSFSNAENVNVFRFPDPPNQYKKMQFIITKAELLPVGIKSGIKIDKIAFRLNGVGGANTQKIVFESVKMGITQSANLSVGSYLSPVRELLLVSKEVSPVNSVDIIVALDKGFVYDESGNLVIELLVKSFSSINNYNSGISISTQAGTNICMSNTGSDVVSVGESVSGTQLNERPAVKLGYCGLYGSASGLDNSLNYFWKPGINKGPNNPISFLNPITLMPNDSINNVLTLLNPLRNDSQFVSLIMTDDSSKCRDTSLLVFPLIKPNTYLNDLDNPDSKLKSDSICTNTLVRLKVDSLYSVPNQNRYGVVWYYLNPGGTNIINPTNNPVNNTTSTTPVYNGTQPKKVPIFGKVFPKVGVRTNLDLCSTDSVNITIFPNAILNFTTPDLSKCPNKTYTLIAKANNFWQTSDSTIADPDSVKFVWDTIPGLVITRGTGKNNEKLAVSNKFTTTYYVSGRGACIDSTVREPIVVTVPFIDSLNLDIAKNEFDKCVNKPIPIDGIITGKTGPVNASAYTYSWLATPNSGGTPAILGNTEDVTYVFPNPGKYTITYKASDSCLYLPKTYTEEVEVSLCDIPNVFTPDGDNNNEYFAVNFAIGQSAKLKVFDRWGKEVYVNENYSCSYGATGIDPSNNCFTAKGLNDGTYFYTLEIPGDKKYQGYVHILNKK